MIVWLAVAALVAVGVMTSFYQVGPESVGIVRRLGRYDAPPREPGLHWRLPFGIESVDVVPTQRQLKSEFGFRTEEVGVTSRYADPRLFEQESLMLTGDLNVALVEWTVQYRISDPYKFLFRVQRPLETFRFMAQAVMREIVGDRTVNEVLTVGRTELAIAVEERLQRLCDQYEIGLNVTQVILQDVTPPDEVKPSFNEVNQAQQEKQRKINEARADYNREVPRAEGRAQQTIEQAEGYAIDRTNRAEGDAKRFAVLVDAYHKAPALTRRRIYIETMEQVLPQVGRKVIVDGSAGNLLQLLDLGGASAAGKGGEK